MQDCRAIVALCLYRFGVLRQGADGIVPCRDQTLLLGRIASGGGGGGCLDSVVQLSGIFLERRLKSGVRHHSLSDAGGWRGELSNTHNVLLDSLYRGRDLLCHYMAFLRYMCAFAAFTIVNSRKQAANLAGRRTREDGAPSAQPVENDKYPACSP